MGSLSLPWQACPKGPAGFVSGLFELYIYVSKAVNPIMTPTDMCATKRLHIRQAVRLIALKFDVDNDSLGPTMEWGFVADLLGRPEALALVDELFVELHFYAPSLRWVHLTHSMKQAFDVLRQLRACGLPVHAWP